MEKKFNIENIIGDSSGIQKGDGRNVKRPHYKRHPKPPYSYLGLAVMAIELSESKMLTLSGVQEEVKKMFPFFAGEYDGWKDSIRHNVSSNPCFVKIDSSGNIAVKGKSKFWAVDLTLVPPNAFKRQETKVSRDGDWALYLHDELGVPPLFEADWSGTTPESNRRHYVTSLPYLSDEALCESPNFEASSLENVKCLDRSNWNISNRDKQNHSMISPNTNAFVSGDPNHSKRQSTNPKPGLPSNMDAVIKLMASPVTGKEESMDANKAVNNLKLLCQNFDVNQSRETGNYYAANPMAYLQKGSCYGYDGISNQIYPYYTGMSSANWWNPFAPSYQSNYYCSTLQNNGNQFGCAPYYGQAALPLGNQDQVGPAFSVVSASTPGVTEASNINMLPNPDAYTPCQVASLVVSQMCGSSPLTSDCNALLQADNNIHESVRN